jgi:hypothetical protein
MNDKIKYAIVMVCGLALTACVTTQPQPDGSTKVRVSLLETPQPAQPAQAEPAAAAAAQAPAAVNPASHDAGASNKKAAPGAPKQRADSGGAGQQLEMLLRCKSGTNFTVGGAESLLNALGLVQKNGNVYFYPRRNGPKAWLFGDEVVSAVVSHEESSEADSRSLTVYLKKQVAKQMAKKLGATKFTKYASESDVEDPRYYQETSKATRLSIGFADEIGDGVKYGSKVICELTVPHVQH